MVTITRIRMQPDSEFIKSDMHKTRYLI